ncbi:uncharacterized protein HMPREF1541_06297 [Cyphellophora europaea CBS 101466]|uniref:Myb-like domain-containing protein n=1 Tax=Cyphellophora europaea (strain CBS 101466) TaxID=1220924 RepID=W2RP06_CYPE1|nr:uncharacterized protein HMPREF1541_06297 [Cyphellophora europaea CBS 101466]ETN38266.1 hypothetical protein HMPREF1541_06297 [Cyphellophora europaea CBS 101466]
MSGSNEGHGRKRGRESESNSPEPNNAAKVRKTVQLPTRKKSEDKMNGVNGSQTDQTVIASTEQDDQNVIVVASQQEGNVDQPEAAERLRRSDTPSVSPGRLAEIQQRQAEAGMVSPRASTTSQGSHSTSNGLPEASKNAMNGQLDGQAPYYSTDALRNAMVRDYFTRNPITDVENVLQAYYQKYSTDLAPFDYGDSTPDKLLMCVCLSTDDGREYIECDNGFKCMKRFFHPGCVGISSVSDLEQGEEWFCPDCMKEGLGGAAAYRKKLAHLKRTPPNLVRGAGATNISGQPIIAGRLNAAAPMVMPASATVKPWTADHDTKFLANPDNLHDLNIETLAMAKETLRARAAQPLGQPVPSAPVVVSGTIVKQPNKNSWSKEEDAVLIECIGAAVKKGLCGNPLWDTVIGELHAKGVDRKLGAARNRWMRGLREETKFDERRKKNSKKLTTAVQIHKDLRDPNSPRRKKRYQVSRKYNDPPGTLVNPSPLKQALSTKSYDVVPPSDSTAPSSPFRPAAVASSPVLNHHVRFAVDGDVDMKNYGDNAGYITDKDDIKDRLVRRRPRND